MGYDVHITRRENWFDEDGPRIDRSEWLALVASDPELRLDGFAEVEVGDGQALRVEDEALAVWVGYSGHHEDGNKAWLRYFEGNVVVRNPDDEILAQMCRMARVLGARVQGDEGEFYDEDDVRDGSGGAAAAGAEAGRRPWWRFW